MVALGFAWFLASLSAFDVPLVFTVGIPLGSVWGAVFIHMLLSFPSGRLETRWRRRVVLAAYAVIGLGYVPVLLFVEAETIAGCNGPCPRNVLPVSHAVAVGEVLLALDGLLIGSICVLVIAMQVIRWRRAAPPERRMLAPIFTAGGVAVAVAALYGATRLDVFLWLAFSCVALTPLAFLAGLASGDVVRSRRVRDFASRLGDTGMSGCASRRPASTSCSTCSTCCWPCR